MKKKISRGKAKHSKRFDEAVKKIDNTKTYALDKAVELLKSVSKTKFNESVEVHFNLGIDPKKGDQQIRATVILPHGTGKTKKIAAFVTPEKEDEAKEAGAEIVGGEELIKEIKQSGKCNFDIAIATPNMMRVLAPIAKILGPKGLMPSPKNETITKDIKKIINELKGGKVAFKNDDTANIHQNIGKISFSNEQLLKNFEVFFDAVKKAKPATLKGTYIKSIYICSTMGPSIKTEILK